MKTKYKIGLGVFATVLVVALTGWYLRLHPIPVLQPAGEIGTKEKNLLIFAASLSIAIVVPVFGLLGYFAWKYREGNKKAKYTPSLGGSKAAEFIWWVVPSVMIFVIAVVTWQSSYALDPYKPIASTKGTLHIQVVALDWKWLFIYPDQHVASVNEVAIPVGAPVDFEITSDSVMSSFWIPQLGGQMYAMPGMASRLHLVADKTGDYRGVSANINGKGFAGMKFTAQALTPAGLQVWINRAHDSTATLTSLSYQQLSVPSQNSPVHYYSSVEASLFDNLMMKDMMPMDAHMHMETNG